MLSLRAGVLLEPLGKLWATYTPASGETQLLNDEAAAVLEVLRDGPVTLATLCSLLASDVGGREGEIALAVEGSLVQLGAAGLIEFH